MLLWYTTQIIQGKEAVEADLARREAHYWFAVLEHCKHARLDNVEGISRFSLAHDTRLFRQDDLLQDVTELPASRVGELLQQRHAAQGLEPPGVAQRGQVSEQAVERLAVQAQQLAYMYRQPSILCYPRKASMYTHTLMVLEHSTGHGRDIAAAFCCVPAAPWAHSVDPDNRFCDQDNRQGEIGQAAPAKAAD